MTGDLLDAGSFLEAAVERARARAGLRIPVIGVAGSQGSGKTTLLRQFAARDPAIAAFSLDDVYLPRAYRQLLAKETHPLFATRGPPGTHNLTELGETLDRLQEAEPASVTLLPAFDKVADNPLPLDRRPVFKGKPSLILLDGWCLGAAPQTEEALISPINALERIDDAEGVWRREVNANLAGGYRTMFDRLDAIIYLRAPSFDVVHAWRCEQEEGLLGRPLSLADRDRIARFIQHFERITRHMLAGGRRADIEVNLGPDRAVLGVRSG